MNKEQKNIVSIYAALSAAMVFQLMPNTSLALFSVLLLLFTWLLIGFMRRGAERGSLMDNHMVFLNVSLWVWSLLVFLATMIGGYYIHTQFSMNDFMQLAQDYAAGKTDTDSVQELKTIMLATAAPCYIYIAYRLTKGLHRAIKGYRIANPKSWL